MWIAELWRYKDYTTIGPGALSDFLARAALEPTRRKQILERTRVVLREQFPIIQNWIAGEGDLFHLIPPLAGDPEPSRPWFRRLVELRDLLADRLRRSLPELSMGMTDDFEAAVEEGATLVRVGRALFGERG